MSEAMQDDVRPLDRIYVGVDPGKTGAAVVLDMRGEFLDCIPFQNTTVRDLNDAIGEWCDAASRVIAVIEDVHAFPRDARKSAFTFGRALGQIETILLAQGAQVHYVSPAKWQMALLHKAARGDKHKLRAAAEDLFPNRRIPLAVADAFLIAQYCYATWR